MRDLQLPNRIRAKAVPAVLVAGWETRGRDGGGFPSFAPKGAVNHHTAGSSRGATPSLNTNIYGRPADNLPGPLAPIMQSREDNLIDKAYVIAVGKCNHGGVGSWTGSGGTMDSNYESHGLEIEHVGTGPVHAARLETAARIVAAMVEGTPARAADMVCQHFEYALPKGRKIDFFNLAPPLSAHLFRERVRYWIGRTTTRPVNPLDPFAPAGSTPPPQEDEDVPWFKRVLGPGVGVRVVTGEGAVAGFPNPTEAAEFINTLKASGYDQGKDLVWAENDDWKRYFAWLTPAHPVADPLYLVQVQGQPVAWLTNGLQRRQATVEDVGIFQWISAATGAPIISTAADGGPHMLGPDQADALARMEDTTPG